MNRRDFFAGTLTAMSASQAAEPPRTRYYLIQNYYLRNSTQLPRLNEFMSQGFLPAANKVNPGPKIFLEALVAAHMPQFVTIAGFRTAEEVASMRAALRQDAAYRKAFAAWEEGPEPPYEHFSQTLLQATDFSPEIPAKAAETPRIFELRTYHSPTWRQLAALQERFAGPEVRIFHRLGIFPVFYTETVLGANMPNLTYLTPFDSLAAREKAWDAFASDPEWVKVRKESIDRHGQISSVIQVTLLKATPYSPIR